MWHACVRVSQHLHLVMVTGMPHWKNVPRECHSFQGELYELLVYNRELSIEEIEQVEEYLMAEWDDILSMH